MDDSVRILLAAYEHDQIPLDSAVQRLANLLQPFGGLSASGDMSPKAREALEATGRELARRAGVPHYADTTISFGLVKRDLTGDGVPETLSLVGVGPALDKLQVTFTVESSGQILFSNAWPFHGPVDGPRRPVSDSTLGARIRGYGHWFFGDSKFMTPSAFIAELQRSARLHIDLIPTVIARETADSTRAAAIWEQMRASPIIIFEFSTGGDAITAIGWSAADKRFYHLLECC